MITPRLVWLALLAASVVACGSPCAELASQTCGRLGEADPQCQELRAVAELPRAGDGNACKASLTFAEELRKGR